MVHDQRQLYEAAVVERLKESGFLEVEIRVECLVRCGDGYQDEVINSGWHYWNAAIAAQPAPETNLHGPYGWLIKPIGLAEDHWYLTVDPSDRPAEEVSVPLFTEEEQKRSTTDEFKPVDCRKADLSREDNSPPAVVTGQMEIASEVTAADLGANAEPGEVSCPACGGAGSVGPFFPGGVSTTCGNCQSPPAETKMTGSLAAIAAERQRQISKGYDAAHDDEHKGGQIVLADWGALARIEAAIKAWLAGDSPAYKELLTEAAAQCAAEIERVERGEDKFNA